MIKTIIGNLLDVTDGYILHQVNCQGKMNSGVAKQIREKYPIVYDWYKSWCDDKHINRDLLGNIQFVYTDNSCKLCVVNLFAQDKYGYDGKVYTSYEAIEKCLRTVGEQLKGKKVALPYNMSCCRGGADWNIIYEMIKTYLSDCDVTIYKLTEV